VLRKIICTVFKRSKYTNTNLFKLVLTKKSKIWKRYKKDILLFYFILFYAFNLQQQAWVLRVQHTKDAVIKMENNLTEAQKKTNFSIFDKCCRKPCRKLVFPITDYIIIGFSDTFSTLPNSVFTKTLSYVIE
jgi:hypothetical protein